MIQFDFTGGMNILDTDIIIGANEYGVSYNIRNRTSGLESILAPEEDTNSPTGPKQGLYGFDVYLILFNNGQAFYKNVVTDSSWVQIADLTVDPSVEYIYTQAVPASRNNNQRALIDPEQIEGDASNKVVATSPIIINGSLAGLVVQDGSYQGWFINADGTARKLQTYEEWTKDAREYVPIMKQMAYINGILFGVDKTGKILYRSVSGRPLDFVVNVTVTSDKGGDAATTSYAVGFEDITCLQPLASGELLVGTAKNLHPVEFDYTNTIFAEPKFLNRKTFSSGIVNQFSFISYLRQDGSGYVDYYFVDFDGLRSFNFASNSSNEGRNSNFSKTIKLVLSPKQSVTAAIVFDDYSFFSISTTLDNENLIAVYDNIRQQWVCFDDYGIGTIKMFAVADQSDNPTLYAITASKVYRLFSSSERLTASVKFRAETSGSISKQIKLSNFYAALTNGTQDGTTIAKQYVDGSFHKSLSHEVSGQPSEPLRFNFQGLAAIGFKVQCEFQWSTDATLVGIETELAGQTNKTPVNQQAKVYA